LERKGVKIGTIATAFLGFTVIMLAGIAYPRDDFVLVVGVPGSDETAMMQTIAGAGGELVSAGRYQWLAVAHSTSPGFAARLMRQGAFLVLDHALASGCLKGKMT
jgi:hypothetical protein